MALPPQMAVPEETKWPVFASILNTFVSSIPINNVLKIDPTIKPRLPALA